MAKWSLEETNNGLRLVPLRSLGSDRFTWAHLLYSRLGPVQVYVVYFPSRFNLVVDKTVIDTMRIIGTNTGPSTSVNVWDTRDPNFEKSLELFDLKSPPALVLATGLQLKEIDPLGPDKANIYTLTITNMDVLSNSDKLHWSINIAHDMRYLLIARNMDTQANIHSESNTQLETSPPTEVCVVCSPHKGIVHVKAYDVVGISKLPPETKSEEYRRPLCHSPIIHNRKDTTLANDGSGP